MLLFIARIYFDTWITGESVGLQIIWHGCIRESDGVLNWTESRQRWKLNWISRRGKLGHTRSGMD